MYRINEVLINYHRAKHNGNSVPFSQRVIAQALPMNPKAVKEFVVNKLSVENSLINDVTSGRKDSSELLDIEAISYGLQAYIQEILDAISDDISEKLIHKLITDLAFDIEDYHTSVSTYSS